MIFWYGYCTSGQYVNKPITHPAGIYYEQVKNVKIVGQHWKLISYLNIKPIHDKLEFIESVYLNTKQLCINEPVYNDLFLCNTPLNLLKITIPYLFQTEQSLRDLMGHTRTKRGLLNIIGTVFKTMFGTLDENDGKLYNDALNEVEKNEKQITNLLSQQIQVVKSTITNFNNTITNLDKNREVFNENFQKLTNFSKDLNNKIFSLEMKQHLDEHFGSLSMFVSELENEISTLINAVLFAKSNSIHPIVISPHQLIDELTKTLPNLPESTSYPFTLTLQNSHSLLELAQIQYYFSDERIIFIMKFPLVSLNHYYLYNLIPLPVYHEKIKAFVFILPPNKYLILSENRNLYTTINTLENCKNLDSSSLICEHNEPLYFTNSRPICETELITVITGIPRNCDTRIFHSRTETWHKLISENSWIYIFPKPTDVTLNCESQKTSHLILNNTGILTLNQNCKLYTSSTILTTESKNSDSSFQHIIPTLELDEECYKKAHNNKNLNLTLVPIIKNLDTDSLNLASKKLEHLEQMADDITNESFFAKVSNNSYFSYIILSIVKIFLFYLGYRLYKKLRSLCCNSPKLNRRNDTTCQNISNCLTLNLCKTKNKCETELELESDKPSISEEVPLRRSMRLIKLKDGA